MAMKYTKRIKVMNRKVGVFTSFGGYLKSDENVRSCSKLNKSVLVQECFYSCNGLRKLVFLFKV